MSQGSPADHPPYKLQTSKLPTTAAGAVMAFLYILLQIGEVLPAAWFAVALVVALLSLLVTKAVVRSEIDVGLDGVMIRKTMRKRFIPYDDIAEVKHEPAVGRGWHRLKIHLHDGAVVEMKTDKHNAPIDALTVTEIIDDITRARAHDAGGTSQALSLVSAEGKDAKTWLAALRALGEKKANYRQRVVSPEQLASVIDDASSPLDAGIGAAVALESATGEGRSRLRIFAEGVADPNDRDRLLRIAEAEDAELEAHLEELTRQAR